MSDLKRLKNIARIADKATAKLEAKNKRIESLIAEIERLEAALRRSCQCGEGMCAITGEQCSACAALEGGDES